MLGRISLRSCRICYVVMTVSNAGFCGLAQQPEIAVGLLIVAVFSARQPTLEWFRTASRDGREWLSDFIRFTDDSVPAEKAGESWLVGCLNFILACVLIGSLAYSLRVESTRNIQSPRHTAIPTRDQLDRFHLGVNGSTKEPLLFDLAFGHRGDVVVLLAAILFLSLAVALNDVRPPVPSFDGTEHHRPSENPL